MVFRSLKLPNETVLRNLYSRQGLSTYKIAEQFDCDPKTIYRYLQLYRIKPRPRKRIFIIESRLLFLYNTKKLSLSAIAEMYDCCAVTILNKMKRHGIARRTISETSTKHEKKDFDGSKEEKAYMIGFRTGDLAVQKRENLIHIKSSTTKDVQVQLIQSLFKNYGPVWIGKGDWKYKRYNVSAALNSSFS